MVLNRLKRPRAKKWVEQEALKGWMGPGLEPMFPEFVCLILIFKQLEQILEADQSLDMQGF